MNVLQEIRRQHLLTQRELAEKAEISVTSLSRIETGKHWPRIITIRRLSAALGMSPEQLRDALVSRQLPLVPVESQES